MENIPMEEKLDAYTMEEKLDAYRRVFAYAVGRLRHYDVPGLHEDFQFLERELRDVGEALAWPSRKLP